MQLKLLVDSLQPLIRTFPQNLPVAVPDAAAGLADAGNSRTGTIHSFRVIKLLAIQIAEGEMCQVNVLDVPRCSLRRITAYRLAEKRQFESVAMAVRRFQISGVIPP